MENLPGPSGDDPGMEMDLAKGKDITAAEYESVKASPFTLEPYIPAELDTPNALGKTQMTRPYSRRNSRRKYFLDPTLVHFDSIFGNENWARYLVLKTESRQLKGWELENLLLSKYPSKDLTFRQIRKDEWLIETTTKKQSESYQSLTNLEGINVVVRKHDQLNSITGTVVLPQSLDQDGLPDRHVLLSSLQIRGYDCTDVEVFEIPNKKNPERKLRIAKIKFDGQNLPQYIKIEGTRREVRPFIPKPLQCRNCSRFGHSTNNCRNNPICAYCSSENHTTKWNCETERCVNCHGNHHSRSKTCPFYLYNTELKLLMSRSGMNVKSAKYELKARGISDPAKSNTYKMTTEKDAKTIDTKDLSTKEQASRASIKGSTSTVASTNKFDILIDEVIEENVNVVTDFRHPTSSEKKTSISISRK